MIIRCHPHSPYQNHPRCLARRVLLAAFFCTVAFPTGASGQEIFVEATGGPGRGSGLMYLVNGQCYVATPNHVVHKGSRTVVLRDKLRRPDRGQIELQDSLNDLALLRLEGRPPARCKAWNRTDHVEDVLRRADRGYLRYATEGGLVSTIEILIEVSEYRITVRLANPQGPRLRAGMSGGGIWVRNVLVGMLILAEDGTVQGEGYTLNHVRSVLGPTTDYIHRQVWTVALESAVHSSELLGPGDLGGQEHVSARRMALVLTSELPIQLSGSLRPRADVGLGLLSILAAETGTNPGGTIGTAVYMRVGGQVVAQLRSEVPEWFAAGRVAALWFPVNRRFELRPSGSESIPISIPVQVVPEFSSHAGAIFQLSPAMGVILAGTGQWTPFTKIRRRELTRHPGAVEAALHVGVRWTLLRD
jgi:hypothetical protein